jgi:hypothetical protein
MIRIFFIMVAAVVLSAAVATAVIHEAGPSTAELDSEIANIKTEIATDDTEAAQYSDGLILIQVRLRAAILKNTLAMLKQKRESFLRWITLNYQDSMPRITAGSDAAAFSELAKARNDAKAAHQEAEMYSGGLIQTMALVREATAKTTEAAIEQRIALAKLGIPMPSPSGTNAAVPKSPGTPTSDRDALR